MALVCPRRINPVIKRTPGESAEEHIERVFAIFLPLMKNVCENSLLNGKRIDIPDYGEPNKYRAFFNHLIQYDLITKKFNYKRLTYCCLVPSIIVFACDDQCVYCFKKDSMSKKGRKTLFCDIHGYVVAFKEYNTYYMVFTGFKPEQNKISKYKD